MKDYDFLVEEAFKALENAYAPYSNYQVGACVLLKDGTLIHGANIENASYGGTSCAERNAVFSVYSKGYRKDDIAAIAIVSHGEYLAGPCGICRQVLSELLNQDTFIILDNRKQRKITNINELLPMQFGPKDLA